MNDATAKHSQPQQTPVSRPTSEWTEWGQWLALITMTLDHVARYLAADDWGMGWVDSSVGRIAFPLFAGMVAWHGLFNTRDPLRYGRRIMVIGLVAQLPYQFMPREALFQFNVCFTLALGLMAGYWAQQIEQRMAGGELTWGRLTLEVVTVVAAWYAAGFWFEYGHQGLLLVPLYMLAMAQIHSAGSVLTERVGAVLAALPVLLLAGMMNSSEIAKSITVLTTLGVLVLAAGLCSLVPRVRWQMPRRLWLAWYPVHFAALAVILSR